MWRIVISSQSWVLARAGIIRNASGQLISKAAQVLPTNTHLPTFTRHQELCTELYVSSHLIFTTTLWDPHCCCYSFTNEKLRFLRDWTLAQSYIAKDLKPGPLPYKVHVLTSCSPLNSCIYYHAYQQHVAGPDQTSQFDPVWTDFKMRNSFQPKHLDLC